MDKYDKSKLKVLIKMILIQQSPNYLTSNQLCSIINNYDWGFRSSITSSVVGKLMAYELGKTGRKHFMDSIELKRSGKYSRYRYVGE